MRKVPGTPAQALRPRCLTPISRITFTNHLHKSPGPLPSGPGAWHSGPGTPALVPGTPGTHPWPPFREALRTGGTSGRTCAYRGSGLVTKTRSYPECSFRSSRSPIPSIAITREATKGDRRRGPTKGTVPTFQPNGGSGAEPPICREAGYGPVHGSL